MAGGKAVAEVARESGVAASAVRYYEEHGLIKAERTSGNQRRFSTTAPCQIKIALVAQRVGLTLREIAEHFRGKRLGSFPDAIWVKTEHKPIYAAEHLDQLRQFTSVMTLTFRVMR
jgi:DNA-binding transcriptional MerR regulator